MSFTHWGWVTHIWVGNLTIIGSCNGLSPVWRQAISVGMLLTKPLGTNFNETLIETQTFSFKKMHLKMSVVCKMSAILSRPQCVHNLSHYHIHIWQVSALTKWLIGSNWYPVVLHIPVVIIVTMKKLIILVTTFDKNSWWNLCSIWSIKCLLAYCVWCFIILFTLWLGFSDENTSRIVISEVFCSVKYSCKKSSFEWLRIHWVRLMN